MTSKHRASAVHMLFFLFLASAICAFGQEQAAHLGGVLNDYTPSTVSGGPYEMHGQWSVNLRKQRNESTTADFVADMTMSDYGTTNGVIDATQGGKNAHTHHIRLTTMNVVWNMAGCPTFSPATTQGFQFSGTVTLITGNGGNAPFEPSPPTSTLQVCVTGGVDVDYSNMTMVFNGPATTHFGPQAIHGVVRKVATEPHDDKHDTQR